MNCPWRWMWSAGVTGAVLAIALGASAQGTPPATPAPAAGPAPGATAPAATAPKAAAAPTDAPVPKDAAATVGDEVISMTELEKNSATELASLEEQRYKLLDRKLGAMIAERLVTQEAKRRGVSLETLLNAEVTAKTPPVTDADVSAFISQNRARLPQRPEAELKTMVTEYLGRMQTSQRTEAFVNGLRADTSVQVFLKPPDPVRVSIDGSIGFARGPADAKITIVEFTDFQCPFCKAVVPTLKEIVTKYSEQVRWVFRDYPIASLHPAAQLVHEAARCAGDQGKFWTYHDLAFDKSPAATPADLREYAAAVGADAAAFNQCLDSHKHRAAVNADIEAGSKLGITGTPTLFVNGQMVVGAQPLAEFQRIIERELARTASAPVPAVNPR